MSPRFCCSMLWLLVVVLCLGVGCQAETTTRVVDGGAPTQDSNKDAGQKWQSAVSFVDGLPGCDIDHRGLLFDFGTDAMVGRYGWHVDSPKGIVAAEHDGATWGRIYDRKVKLSFYLSEPTRVFVSARTIGRNARYIRVLLDGYLLGTMKLKNGGVKVPATSLSRLPLSAGLHQLTLLFRGRTGSNADPFAELDWLRVGVPGEQKRTYGAPTLFDVNAPSSQLAGVPHRSLALHAPAVVRCSLRVPPKSRLRFAVGMRGSGSGRAAITVREDGKRATRLYEADIKGGPNATWTNVDLPLDEFSLRQVSIEFIALKTVGTGRLLFGDPSVVVADVEDPPPLQARTAVVVVLSGVSRSDLPPWRNGPTPHLPTLNMLTQSGVVFDNHRSSSTLVAGAVASILSGVSPRVHTVADSGARLASSVRTLGGMVRDASILAAMFTGVPTTFKSFGFSAQWESFSQYPPNEGRLATAPIDDAARWLVDNPDSGKQPRPMLAFVHARGGHPPWEVTPEQASRLPPDDYAGYLGPRRAAQYLAKLGGRHSRLSDADRERMRALYLTGLAGQDRALGELIERLEKAGRWESTLLIVTGDVASARQTMFVDGLALDEQLLTVPLYVHFPGGRFGAERIEEATEAPDITRTVLEMLNLQPPDDMGGVNLADTSSGKFRGEQRVRLAVLDDRYSARWGDIALVGRFDESPRLCRLLIDPYCAFNSRNILPIAAQALFRRLAVYERGLERVSREPLTLDSDTAAMLKVWGTY